MGRQYRKVRDPFYCTDEVCSWFGGRVFSAKSGKKLLINNLQDVTKRVTRTWGNVGDFPNPLYWFFQEDPKTGTKRSKQKAWKAGSFMDYKGEKDSIMRIPNLSAPARNAGYKGKTYSQSKSRYRKDCKKEVEKGNTPLGFITAVAPTRAEAKKEYRENQWRGGPGQFGGTGHVFAVDCNGKIVADTAPGWHKGKKIRRNNIFTIPSVQNLTPNQLRRSGSWKQPTGFVQGIYDLFNTPLGQSWRRGLTDWRWREGGGA